MNESDVTICDLYPHMNREELAKAETNLKRYVVVLIRIHDRLRREGKSRLDDHRLTDLTAEPNPSMIPNERSNSPKKPTNN